MKKTLLFSALIAGLALSGCNKSTRTDTVSTDPMTPTSSTDSVANRTETAAREAGNDISRAANSAAASMSNMAHDVSAKVTEWRLSNSDIQADLAADREIVRTRSGNLSPTGNIDKSTLQSAVEGRIRADAELSSLKLDVNGKANGEIQLEGKALTSDQVGRAIALALDTDGVSKVTSKIKLDKDAVKNR